ncbi:MAG: fatty acid desaturase [Armatimonadota bacterium]
MPEAGGAGRRSERPEWYLELAKYEQPSGRSALRQLANTGLPLLGVLALMFYTVTQGMSYWLTLALSVPAAGLLIRSFIFLHDASHGSFFPSPRANGALGFIIGVLTLTPYGQWRWSHLKHHGAFANLDRRGLGDIMTMTVAEYRAAPRWEQLKYHIYRHPLIMFGIGSTLLFGLIYRFPIKGAPRPDRRNVWLTDIAILAVAAASTLTIGIRPFILVMAPIWIIAWTAGVWLFYVQHQFQGVYWARQDEWDFFRASLEGASYYRLPKPLQWITGNIGLHHLHHLRPRIPNYRLQQAYDATPAVQAVTPLTLRTSLTSLRLNLYDEEQKRMVGFRELEESD